MAGNPKEYQMLFRLQAETAQYQKAMGTASQEMGILKSSLSALDGGMKDIAGYQKQQQALQANQQKAAGLKSEYDRLKAELKAGGGENTQLQAKVKKTGDELNKVNAKIKEQEQALARDGEKLRAAGIDTRDLNGENARLKAGYDDLARSQADIAGLESAQKANKEAISATTAELGRTVAAYAAVGVAAYKAFISPAAEFEAQMSVAESISGASAGEMEQLATLAKEMGATTKFTAVESAKGYEYMAMAGWDAQEMMAGLPGIIQLAAASGEDLASVSDIVTDALTAFGLKASDSGHFSDVLAMTSARANTNVGLMGETFKYVAPMAGAMGYSVEDMAVSIGLMANSGIKGSMAGTSLRNIIANMAAPTDQVATAMEQLGVSISNADGSARPFEAVMADIRDGMDGMTEAEKVATASAIAGKRGMSGLLAVVNATEEEYAALYEEVDHCAGAAQRMSEVRMDNLKGDVTIMQSAWEGFATVIGEEFTPDLRELVQHVTEAIDAARDWAKENGDTIRQIVGVVGALGGLKLGLLATKLVGLQFTKGLLSAQMAVTKLGAGLKLLRGGQSLGAVVKGMTAAGTATAGAATAAQGAAGAATAAAGGMSAFALAGAGAVVAAVAVGAAVYKLWQDAKQADLASRFGDIALSMEDMDQVAAHLVENDRMNGVAQALDVFGNVDQVAADIAAASRELEKYEWKVGIGLQLSQEDQGDYKESMCAYVDQLQGYLEDQGYALQLGMEVMFAGDAPTGELALGNVAAVTQAMQGKVADMGAELAQHMAAAFEGGMFDIDEYQAAAELQAKLAEIERVVADSDYKAKMDALGSEYGGALTVDSYKELMVRAGELAEQNATDLKASYEKTLSAAYSNVAQAEWLYQQEPTDRNRALWEESEQALEAAREQVKNAPAIAAQSYAGVVDFGLNTIYEAYPELKRILDDTKKSVSGAYQEASKSGKMSQKELQASVAESTKDQRAQYRDLSAETRSNISNQIGAIREYVEEVKKAGADVPDEINEIIRAFDLLGVVTMPGPVSTAHQGVTVESNGNAYYVDDYTARYKPETDGAANLKNGRDILGGVARSRLPELVGQMQGGLPGFAEQTEARTVEAFLRSVPGFAVGTNSTPAAFVAGERGPELITNAPNRTVFTHGETERLLSPSAMAPRAVRPEVRVELHSNPTIYTNGGVEELKAALLERDEALLDRAVARVRELDEDERRLRYG